jgi:hypothetical protein
LAAADAAEVDRDAETMSQEAGLRHYIAAR